MHSKIIFAIASLMLTASPALAAQQGANKGPTKAAEKTYCLQFSTDTVCTQNAFGGAFVLSNLQTQVQSSLDASVQSGATSILFAM